MMIFNTQKMRKQSTSLVGLLNMQRKLKCQGSKEVGKESGICSVISWPGLWEFSSVAQLCLTLCDPIDCSTPGLPAHHQLPEFTQTQVHWVSDAIQPFHPLSSPSPPTFHLPQHQGLFQWVSSLHQVTKVLELQYQSFQRIFKVDFL